MARKAREKSDSGIYHVMLRGINRQSIFADDEERQKFIGDLVKYKNMNQCRLFAYCLMDNHVHLLLQETVEASMSRMIQQISASYVLWYNRKHRRCGHLFQERFKSEAVETDGYFLTVLRYIHQNPVKAAMVGDMTAYSWSSYGQYAGEARIVDKAYVLQLFAQQSEGDIGRFVQFLEEANDDVCLDMSDLRVILEDDDLRQTVKQQFDMEIAELGKETREKQDYVLRALKKIKGATIRQIARVAGVSPTRVWKA